MHKKVEELIEKHLTNVICEIVIEVCNKHFDEVFSHFKAHRQANDTTIGSTFRELEKRAAEAVSIRLGDWMNEVTDEMGIVRATVTKNPFSEIAYQLWDSFLYYYDIKGIVESHIEDEWSYKAEKLKEAGVINDDGDAI